MRRSSLAIIMCVLLSAAVLQAQRGGGGGGGAHGAAHAPAARAGAPGSNWGITGPGGRRRGNFYNYGYGWPGYYGGYGMDWDLPYWDYVNFPPNGAAQPPDDQAEGYMSNQAPRQVVAMRDRGPAMPVVESPKLIEVPLPAGTVVKPQPPALFVLTNGEKLESRRYVVSADSLQIDVDRKQRTIPISQVNVDATIAANLQRGIEVSIPQDRSSLFVGF
jgi:hypothetical protein